MIRNGRGRSRLLIPLICLALCSACESVKTVEPPIEEPPQESPVVTPLPDIPDSQRFAEALKLLEYGEEEQARVELETYLSRFPNRTKAKRLLDQITTDPSDYYPYESFTVKLKAGEALATLASRYLGDSRQFYALAKFNGIARPRRVYVDQTIRIPLTPYAQRVRAAASKPTEPEPPAEAPPAPTPEPPAPPPAADAEIADAEIADAKIADEEKRLADLRIAQAAQYAEEANRRLDEGDRLAAMNNYRQAVEFDPDNQAYQTSLASVAQQLVDEYHREALLAYRRQQLDLSIEMWDKLLAIDPGHADAQVYRAKAIDLKNRLKRKTRTPGDSDSR